jgi:putative copper export protein
MFVFYLLAVWVHMLTIAVWIGAMFFQDPRSQRLPSRMVEKMHGVGWSAQAVVWTTGLFMLYYRGISPGRLFSSEFIATGWGRAMWVKLGLVLLMAVFQVIAGHKGMLPGYLLAIFSIVGISVLLVRPFFL